MGIKAYELWYCDLNTYLRAERASRSIQHSKDNAVYVSHYKDVPKCSCAYPCTAMVHIR